MLTLLGVLFCCSASFAQGRTTIEIKAQQGSANKSLEQALRQAATLKGKPVTIKLDPGIYNLKRTDAIQKLYYVSNTTSEQEDADPTKHIGLLLSGLKNVTLDGTGSTLLMDGEMTSFVVDGCENITLKNFCIDHKHPTQTEITVTENGKDYLIAKVHPTSQYRITSDNKLEWYGEGWSFTNGIAQMYDPFRDLTWRSWSPMENLVKAVEMRPGMLYLQYSQKPDIPVHTTFQIRDAIRDEVCGFVNQSKNVRLENIHFYYLGNFGVVCQTSENITVDKCDFGPRPGSGRTNAGFADFIQVSGCKGMVDIKDSRFVGAHDDPINIHGTHLKVIELTAPDRAKVRYMHSQTYGFQSFFKGDDIEWVDTQSLLCVAKSKIKSAKMLSEREIEITLSQPLPASVTQHKGDLAVENVTWTPEVRITGNYFARIPTRGILITTRRKSLIENNTFYGTMMCGIQVCDDALGWFESGPVHDLTIRQNTFLECGEPVICIEPENRNDQGAVHKNITIEGNSFYMRDNGSRAIHAKSVDGVTIKNNLIYSRTPDKKQVSDFVNTNNSTRVTMENNKVQQ